MIPKTLHLPRKRPDKHSPTGCLETRSDPSEPTRPAVRGPVPRVRLRGGTGFLDKRAAFTAAEEQA
jgi:hypothetical protein